MNIQRFVKETASPAHEGTILASPFLPEGMKAPFRSAWGYLEGPGELEAHAHPDEEIYVVIQGRGRVVVGDEQAEVASGDVIEIPPNTMHKIICDGEGPLLWAALWWSIG